MHKALLSFLVSLLLFSSSSISQCLTALPPPACTGSEPLISDGETISGGTTKWYYGAATTINSLTLDGGTLVICGNLTVDKFYMNTGKIFVLQGGRLVIGSGIGAGLQFKGDCALYNYGTVECQRNLTLENNATATTPNIVINVLNSSVFRMPNQYFVIGNAFSKFVNNGLAEFWGLITDNGSTAGSVCLGTGSATKMAVLINKIANSYAVPDGNACLYVYQFSQFYGQLTTNPAMLVCLAPTHSSDASCVPFGCHPNYWGMAQVFTNCAGCAAIAILPVQFSSFTAVNTGEGTTKLSWHMDAPVTEGVFTILRSDDGKNFYPLDSMAAPQGDSSSFQFVDKNPFPRNNYYTMRFTNRQSHLTVTSKMLKVASEIMIGFNIYPVPFDNRFFINYERGTHPLQIVLTDLAGKIIQTRCAIHENNQTVEIDVMDKIQGGLYIVHMQTDKSVVAKTIFKR